MVEAFVQVPKHILFDPNLSNNAKVAYSALLDRMSLSRQHKSYYSDRHHDFFVLFSQKQMADVLGLCERTVNTIYKELESHNLIQREAQFNASDRIFLPVTAKITDMEPQELQTINTKTNNTKINTNDTVNTESPKKDEKEPSLLKRWEIAVTDKLKLTQGVVDAIKSVANNDYNKCYQLTGIMNNAKKHVVVKYGVKNALSRYETNVNLKSGLQDKIYYASHYLPKNEQSQLKYWTSVFKDFFKRSFGLEYYDQVDPSISLDDEFQKQRKALKRDIALKQASGEWPIIPMFKIQ